MKAIFVVDTTKCRGCPFCHESAYYSWCDAPRKERFWEMPLTSKDIEEERTVECPLKPMPNRIDWLENGYNGGWVMFSTGWNACINEITGETE